MPYGDFGYGDDSWDEPQRCYHCGRKSHGLRCASCDEGGTSDQVPGWYAVGWLWDYDEPSLKHKALHRFGPFLTEDKAKMVCENLDSQDDLKPQVYEVQKIQVGPKRKIHDGSYLIPMARR